MWLKTCQKHKKTKQQFSQAFNQTGYVQKEKKNSWGFSEWFGVAIMVYLMTREPLTDPENAMVDWIS